MCVREPRACHARALVRVEDEDGEDVMLGDGKLQAQQVSIRQLCPAILLKLDNTHKSPR